MSSQTIRQIVFSSLFAALISAGAYIALPVGPVPIVLSTFFVLLAGVLSGWKTALYASLLYLLLGCLGLPVFSKGGAGIAHLVGPTGGYLMAYPLAAFATGFISEKGQWRFSMIILAVTAGSLSFYLLGAPWLKFSRGMDWMSTFKYGVLPFLLGDAIKAVVVILIYQGRSYALARD